MSNFKYIDQHRSENTSYWMAKQGPFLFDMNYDQNESYDVSAHFAEKMKELEKNLLTKREQMERNPRGWKTAVN